MAREWSVLTAIGTDRVGIVDDISGAVLEHGCNIEESKMAVLGREFAIIMLVSGPPASVSSLGAKVGDLGGSLGMHIELKRTREPAGMETGRPYLLETSSLDTPGIVHSVTALLRRYGINIEDLETETAAAPWTGAPLFRMRAHLIVPSSISVAQLKDEFTRLQQTQDLDIELKPVFGKRGEP
jgi:glycine cleavage system transcriptional repressor